MDERVKRLLGEGPYPFSIDDINGKSRIESFLGQEMIVLSTKDTINMPKGSHAHESYEFLIPSTEMRNTMVGSKITNFEKNKLFPINAEQPHGPTVEIKECNLLGFQIGRNTFNNITQDYCKKKDIAFENTSKKIGNEITFLLKMFMDETRNLQTGSEFILQNIINLIAMNLLRQVKSNIPIIVTKKDYFERENISRAISYLNEEYNSEFSLEDVARIANLSQYHFIRTFKSVTGKTPYDYLLDIKIDKSKILLKIKKYSITDVCFMCGFNSLGHFSTVFKRKVGILPSQFRKI